MIKLGKLTDYAIVVMGQLLKEGRACSAHYLSGKTGLPEPTVSKVLKSLAKKELLVSVRGVTGGYNLARDAAQISLAEIITAMDGPISVVSCMNGRVKSCRLQGTCPTKDRWSKVNKKIVQTLEETKLTEMVA